MKKIIAFSGSNSPDSINQKLVVAAVNKLSQAAVHLITLSDFDVPIYGEEIENEMGIPEPILQLHACFAMADGFIIASPEHNGLPPAFFKNIIDWLSRINQKIFNHKPVLLLSTSPGSMGGQSNLTILKGLLPRWGAQVISTYALGDFAAKWNETTQCIIGEDDEQLTMVIEQFSAAIFKFAPAA